jgi:hypothetical protein
MKALIAQGIVAQIEAQEFPVALPFFWVECDETAQTGWVYNEVTQSVEPPPVPEKSEAEIMFEYQQAMQSHVNLTAMQRDYENGVACASYANSSNLKWKAEAEAFIIWRDAIWSYAIAFYDEIQQTGILPDVETFISNAPEMTWPELEE